MRLTYARCHPVFSWTCLRCQKHESTHNTEPMVDLDGPAFKAYYHSHCAVIVEIEHNRTSETPAEWVPQVDQNVYYFPGDYDAN